MKTALGAEYAGEQFLDCAIPQCDDCPLVSVDSESVGPDYPVDARLVWDSSEEDYVVVEGEVAPEVIEAVRQAVLHKKRGLCHKPEIDVI